MRKLDFDVDHPETRTNHGETRDYGHGSPDIGMSFTISVTKDLLEYLRVRNTRNANKVLPIYHLGFQRNCK